MHYLMVLVIAVFMAMYLGLGIGRITAYEHRGWVRVVMTANRILRNLWNSAKLRGATGRRARLPRRAGGRRCPSCRKSGLRSRMGAEKRLPN